MNENNNKEQKKSDPKNIREGKKHKQKKDFIIFRRYQRDIWFILKPCSIIRLENILHSTKAWY
jgi:hypothetical protein